MRLTELSDRLRSRPRKEPATPRRVALALSGGAVRGAAHVGVFEVLEREGIHPDLVVGTSAGSVAGALYCAGLSTDQMRAELRALKWSRIARMTRPKLGLFDTSRLETRIEKITGGPTEFSDLKIPFAAVATDVASQTPVTLTSGRLALAVRASCAVPGVFSPVEIDGRLLVDGGLVANLPVAVARRLGATYVIAVDLLAGSGEERLPRNLAEMWMLSYYAVMRKVCQDDRNVADARITPDMRRFNLWDFSQWENLVAAGRAAAELALPQLQQDLADD